MHKKKLKSDYKKLGVVLSGMRTNTQTLSKLNAETGNIVDMGIINENTERVYTQYCNLTNKNSKG